VVVTFNYRLGLLGFLAHPALGAESPHRSSGNYALLDQIAALRWVRHNIDAFGGDPDRVTVFGHSAGGDAIAQLLASPLAKGLFHRAVIQSGGLGTARARGEMEAEGLKVAGALGVPPADPLPALRALPVDALLAASAPFDAVVDGWVVPEPGPGVLSSGHGRTIPLLVGATRDEANVFALPRDPESHRAAVEETGAAWKDQVAALYPAGGDALSRLMTDRDFVCPARYVAARRRGPTWLYLLSSSPTPGPGGTSLGAFHGADVRVLFDLTYGLPRNASEQRIGDAMRRYWVHFAATGNPNPPGLPTWPRYAGPEPAHLELDDPIQVRPALGGAGCDLFDRMWDASFAAPRGGWRGVTARVPRTAGRASRAGS
jgi:para-nitrobenzyl esterase